MAESTGTGSWRIHFIENSSESHSNTEQIGESINGINENKSNSIINKNTSKLNIPLNNEYSSIVELKNTQTTLDLNTPKNQSVLINNNKDLFDSTQYYVNSLEINEPQYEDLTKNYGTILTQASNGPTAKVSSNDINYYDPKFTYSKTDEPTALGNIIDYDGADIELAAKAIRDLIENNSINKKTIEYNNESSSSNNEQLEASSSSKKYNTEYSGSNFQIKNIENKSVTNEYKELNETFYQDHLNDVASNPAPSYDLYVNDDGQSLLTTLAQLFTKSSGGINYAETMFYPDAMSNMYDVYFRIRDDSGNDDELGTGHKVIKAMFKGQLLSARISKIDIPAYERETRSISVWGLKINKQGSKINSKNEGSFTIRMDTRLIYIDMFNDLAGVRLGNLLNRAKAYNDIYANSNFDLAPDSITTKIKDAAEDSGLNEENFYEDEGKLQENEIRNNLLEETVVNTIPDYVETALDRFNSTDSTYITPEDALFDLYNNSTEENTNTSKTGLNYKNLLEDARTKVNVWGAGLSSEDFTKLRKAWVKKQYDLKQYQRKVAYENIVGKNYNMSALEDSGNSSLISAITGTVSGGTSRTSGLKMNPPSSDTIEAFRFLNDIIMNTLTVETRESPYYLYKDLDTLCNSKRLDIIVRRVPSNISLDSSKKATTSTVLTSFLQTDKVDERWIFEDVKILGPSNSISFKRESAGPEEMTYKFTYKRLYKDDLYVSSTDYIDVGLKTILGMAENAAVKAIGSAINKGTTALKEIIYY